MGLFASLATMFGTGFNHFWHAETADHGGDLLYIQGHSSPGIYARAFMKPVWDGKTFQPRLMLPLSLSYDHRVIDGASAARFNAYLASILADFRRVVL